MHLFELKRTPVSVRGSCGNVPLIVCVSSKCQTLGLGLAALLSTSLLRLIFETQSLRGLSMTFLPLCF